jgi:hypothetical protein
VSNIDLNGRWRCSRLLVKADFSKSMKEKADESAAVYVEKKENQSENLNQ